MRIDFIAAAGIEHLQKAAHENAVRKKFYETPPTFGEQIALVHSELSEALEDYRAGRKINAVYTERDADGNNKPVGVPIELADAVIRICDLCEHHGINLGEAILDKMRYNKTRPERHGGKVI